MPRIAACKLGLALHPSQHTDTILHIRTVHTPTQNLLFCTEVHLLHVEKYWRVFGFTASVLIPYRNPPPTLIAP